jgi:hypothetical protein
MNAALTAASVMSVSTKYRRAVHRNNKQMGSRELHAANTMSRHFPDRPVRWKAERPYSRTPVILLLMVLSGSNALEAAEAKQNVQKGAVLTTMTEAIVAAASLIGDRSGMQFASVSWFGTYSERDWALRLQGKLTNGEAFGFGMSGYLWGEDKEDWLVTYAGLGDLGKESIRINGKAVWQYDASISDHVAMNFEQNIKFGEHSTWGWVLGAEIIFGGSIGAGAAIATAGLATGGVALGASVWIGAGGFATGATALVCASDAAKNLIEADTPPPAPPSPKRPPIPKNGEKLFPQKGAIYTAVSRDGTILGSGPDGVLVISGSFDGTTASGTISPRKQ